MKQLVQDLKDRIHHVTYLAVRGALFLVARANLTCLLNLLEEQLDEYGHRPHQLRLVNRVYIYERL